MSSPKIATGVVHTVPKDLHSILTSDNKVREVWNDGTPLARNEWLCWITSAKKGETRERRIRIMTENLIQGQRRPCCWAGCTHR